MSNSMIRGFLKIVVLKALADSPKSGYSLMKYIEEKTGTKPSPGSMYPLLDSLKADGLIEVKALGRSNEYHLTVEGKKQVKEVEDKREECLKSFSSGMKVMSALTGEDLSVHQEFIESMHKGDVPFKELNPELDNFRTVLFSLLKQDVLKNKSVKIKRILSQACKELKSV